jgi:hypothetical protein
MPIPKLRTPLNKKAISVSFDTRGPESVSILEHRSLQAKEGHLSKIYLDWLCEAKLFELVKANDLERLVVKRKDRKYNPAQTTWYKILIHPTKAGRQGFFQKQ